MGPSAIRAIEPGEAEALLDTLTLAFATDPCVRFIWPRTGDFLRFYRRLAAAQAGEAFARGGGFAMAEFEAVAIWRPPGAEADEAAMGALIGEAVAPEKQATIGQVAEQMQGYHPTAPHWYLSMIGVDPSRQGEGLGSALLKHTLRLVDADRLPAYLESSNPKNVPLYERHGFEVMGVIQPDDFPPIVPMLRPERRA